MTVIRPNSVSGINSITVQSGNSLAVHKANGELIRTLTSSSGVSTFSTLSVGSATTDNSAAKSVNIGLGASISQHNDNTLSLGTGGRERFLINSTGRIGIKNNLSNTFDSNANTLCIGDGGGAVGLTFYTAAAADGSHISFTESTGSTSEGMISYYQGSYGTANDRDAMIFKTNGGERLRITSAGLVGIGSDVPTESLDVEGNTTIASNGRVNIYRPTGTATNSALVINSNVGSTDKTQFIIQAGGSVGIGTDTPSHKLDISNDGIAFPSAAGSTLLRLRNSAGSATLSIDANAGNVSAIQFGDTAAASRGGILYNHASNHLQFNTGTGGEKMRIGVAGTVTTTYQIVNDTSPDFPFIISQVDPSNTVNQLGGSGVGMIFKPATNGDAAIGAALAAIKPGGNDGETDTDLAFYVSQNDETLDEALRLDHDLNLGLGIIAVPQDTGARTIHVHSTTSGGSARAAIRLTHADSGTSASNGAFIGFDANPDFYLFNQESGNIRFGINGTDEFKISSTNGRLERSFGGGSGSGSDLDGMWFNNDQAATGTFVRFWQTSGGYGANQIGSISHTANNTAYNTSSDYRLKENAISISDGITRLKELKPYRFNFKTEPSKTVDGFFAHEAATVVPEAVTGAKDAVAGADDDMYKVGDPIHQGMDYGKITPLLTAALQEAITKIETLETKVAALEGG